jgi:hypothetical protein
MRRTLAAVAMLLVAAGAASAQDPLFVSGPIEWTPSVTLTEFGYDSNLFLAPKGREVEDITGTLTPAVSATLFTPRLEFTGSAGFDLVYFERYVEQRTFNQRYAGRTAVALSLFKPYVAADWQRVRDRQSPEVDLRARRVARSTTIGLGLFSLSRGSLDVSVGRNDIEYEEGQAFQGAELSQELNRAGDVMTLGFDFALTPLTTLTASASVQRDRYPLVAGKDQENQRVRLGVQFSPDAVLRGHATFGYSRLTVEDENAIPFTGFTTDVDISYSLLGITQFLVRYGRETTASIQEPYYLQTTYGLEVQQAFLGPVELLVRGSRQELTYPGLPSRELLGHTDFMDTYAAGFLVRLSNTSSVNTTYEVRHRESTDENLRFDARRLITTVLLGF